MYVNLFKKIFYRIKISSYKELVSIIKYRLNIGFFYNLIYYRKIRNYFSIINNKKIILIISHNCSRSGAPFVALNIAKELNKNFNKEIVFLTINGGELVKDFQDAGFLINLEQSTELYIEDNNYVNKIFHNHLKNNVEYVICNSVVSGVFIPLLENYKLKYINLIHELPETINEKNYVTLAENIALNSKKIIFPTEYVAKKFNQEYKIENARIIIHPQGVNFNNKYYGFKDEVKKLFNEKYKIDSNSKIVLGAGNGFNRKGIDLFFDVADEILKFSNNKDIHFIWLGRKEYPLSRNLENKLREKKYYNNIHFINAVDDPSLIFARADVFLLTSRVDPFPTVVLDEMDAGVPVIVFKDGGGIYELLNDGSGIVIDNFNIEEMATECLNLLNNNALTKEYILKAKNKIIKTYNYHNYVSVINKLMIRS